jgi:hypothetical protein
MSAPVGQRELLFNAVHPSAGASPSAGSRAALLRAVLPWLLLLVITLCWDRAVYLRVTVRGPSGAAMKDSGWYTTLRALGTLYPWGGLAVLLLLIDVGGRGATLRDPLRRAVFLFLCPLLAGGAAELLKPLVGRFKPEETDGWFVFASLADRIHRWSDLGVASSHTAVACGAAFALSTLYPRGTAVFVGAGIGCAMTRLLAGGHFLSDVYIAIVLAYFVTRGVRALDARNNAGVALGP